jgi:putative transcriptional regulator
MITCRLPILLAERRINRTELMEKSGIHLNTLRPLYNDTWKRVDRNTMDKICKVLQCQVGDLFVYVEGEPEKKVKGTKSKKGGK